MPILKEKSQNPNHSPLNSLFSEISAKPSKKTNTEQAEVTAGRQPNSNIIMSEKDQFQMQITNSFFSTEAQKEHPKASTRHEEHIAAKHEPNSQISCATDNGKEKQSAHMRADTLTESKMAIQHAQGKPEIIAKHQHTTNEDGSPTQIVTIEISKILPNPNQPRKIFSEISILKLADSISQFGVIQPLTVRKTGQLYELVAGERRLRAAKELGWKCVPCIISDITEEKSAQISIIENLIREDLNIFEQALAIEALIDTYSLTQEQIAEKLSSSQSYIANKLRLLRFSTEEREIILANQLTERHARALLRINDPNIRKIYLIKIIKDELNVTNTEILIGEYLSKSDQNTEGRTQSSFKQKTISSFYNTIKRAIDSIKNTDLGIKCQKFVGETHTEILIKIPNEIQDKCNCDDK